MGDFGDKRNGSGYVDLTAYEAITAADKPQDGEIWAQRDWRTGEETEVLIIKAHDDFCNVLMLFDEERQGNIEVISRSVKYTDPGKLIYSTNNRMSQFVRKLSSDEFLAVTDAVERELGLVIAVTQGESFESMRASEMETAMLRAKLDEVEAEVEQLRRRVESVTELLNIEDRENNALRDQIAFVKTLYDELLQKVLDGGRR